MATKFPNKQPKTQEKTGKLGKKEKNRKRRVYDAINVAISTGDIKKFKEKKKFYIQKSSQIIGQVTADMIEKRQKFLENMEKKLYLLKGLHKN